MSPAVRRRLVWSGLIWGRLACGLSLALVAGSSWWAVVAGGDPMDLASAHALFRLPPVGAPEENPITEAKVKLGRKLFFDPGLSADGSVSCASCHRPERFFADDRPLSFGIGHAAGDRNVPTLLNAVYSSSLMWDGRSTSLEDQVRYPVTHPNEMSMTPEKVEDYLAASPEYTALFQEAFDEDWIGWEQICQALAAFERTLLSGNAPFDRFLAGDAGAVPPAARRGWELFRGKAGCVSCHHHSAEQPFFTDFEFHNAGVGWSAEKPDLGRYQISKAREDKGAFRTPSLRNVAMTAPYMHDGSLPDLAAVLEHYVKGGEPNPLLDLRIRPLDLSAGEKLDLIAFLESLTGEMSYTPDPTMVTASRGAPDP